MATKRVKKTPVEAEVVEEKQPKLKYQTFTVQAGFPAEEEDGWVYQTLGEAATFNIARDAAFALARRGLRVRYPQPENERNDKYGWYVATKEKAEELSDQTWERYAAESVVDRAQITSNEMKARSRVGAILGELRGIIEQTRSPQARRALRAGMLEISQAAFAPVNAANVGNIGFVAAANYMDVLAEAIGAQGIEFDQACVDCGEAHNAVEGMTILQVLQLADAAFVQDVDPIADAMVGVEGVQA